MAPLAWLFIPLLGVFRNAKYKRRILEQVELMFWNPRYNLTPKYGSFILALILLLPVIRKMWDKSAE